MKNSYKSDYVDYSPFWQLLEQKRITQYQLINQFNVNSRTLSKLRKGGNLNIYTISDLCHILNCEIKISSAYQKSETSPRNNDASLPHL